ncbi:phage baseplate assembly protein V [Formicincola oecophyllae]|uniref:Phage baseplate assembly protein V n=1 Tax=Formicincola oecophyllae TaxID=2558361 RepID=A0A4Y6U991_9PROT|nr:phage baseplate assembly protein V [Formicincola oecophyllae]QDH14033.1 phage baseplate assembly protein V [Formicincola oecophyllae]
MSGPLGADAHTHRVLGEHDRQIASMARLGVVAAVQGLCARVAIGSLLTDWLYTLTPRAAQGAVWWQPSVGEQVVVLALHGDVSQGVILGSIWQDKYPPPAQGAVWGKRFSDGTLLTYDPQSHALTLEGGQSPLAIHVKNATLKAESLTLNAPSVHCTGSMVVEGDVTAKGVSVAGHVHGGVKSGSEETSAPS